MALPDPSQWPHRPNQSSHHHNGLFVLFAKPPTTHPSSLNQQLNFHVGKRGKNLSRSRSRYRSRHELRFSRSRVKEKVAANTTRTSTAPLEKERNNWRCWQLLFLRKSAGCAGNSRMAAQHLSFPSFSTSAAQDKTKSTLIGISEGKAAQPQAKPELLDIPRLRGSVSTPSDTALIYSFSLNCCSLAGACLKSDFTRGLLSNLHRHLSV